ncbi:MAG TPA: sulfate permease [Methylomirabilota bacterium]|nr:sulfate permease [Methylomirabilota bacterium]
MEKAGRRINLERVFPFLEWRRLITPHTLSRDLVAGLVVALVLIPQSLAYAQLAGVPVYFGLYASMLPVAVGALFGSSRQLATGPVAMTSLLTAASITPLADPGTPQFIAYAILLALLSGAAQLILGCLRMGVFVNFLSHPVLVGFTNAAAIVIALSQLSAFLAVPMGKSGHFLEDLWSLFGRVSHLHWITAGMGLSALALMWLLKQTAPRLPGVLIAVVLSTTVSYLVGYAELGGGVVGHIPQRLPRLTVPRPEWRAGIQLLPAALVIALISFMEAMASARVIATRTRVPLNINQELVGQGLAKIAGALSQSFPVSGSFSRSALNLAMGAQTGASALFTALFVLLTLLFLTPLLYHLPLSVLAAIITMAVLPLVNARGMRDAWRARPDDGMAAVTTFVATLMFAPYIQTGILAGIVLSLVFFLYRSMTPRVVVLGRDKDGTLRNAARFNLPPLHPKIAAIRFDGQLYFANVSYFEDFILRLVSEAPAVRFILVVSDGINGLDASGVEMLRHLIDRLAENGITLVFSGVKKQVRDVMERTGLDGKIGPENIFRLVSTEKMALEAIGARLEAEAVGLEPGGAPGRRAVS